MRNRFYIPGSISARDDMPLWDLESLDQVGVTFFHNNVITIVMLSSLFPSPGDAKVVSSQGFVGPALRPPGQRQQPRLQVRVAALKIYDVMNFSFEFISGRSWSTLCRSQPQCPQSAACQLQVTLAAH